GKRYYMFLIKIIENRCKTALNPYI
ncbi:hypothetical protein FTRO_0290010, partial [Fructobacillus tropaeoli]